MNSIAPNLEKILDFAAYIGFIFTYYIRLFYKNGFDIYKFVYAKTA